MTILEHEGLWPRKIADLQSGPITADTVEWDLRCRVGTSTTAIGAWSTGANSWGVG